jgi:cytochrome c biogenesis protein CcdA
MVAFHASLPGIFIFGHLAGICPCNRVLCLGLVTILMYGVGLSIPLIIISSPGGAAGKMVKEKERASGEVFDRVIGVVIVLMGVNFLYLAFA